MPKVAHVRDRMRPWYGEYDRISQAEWFIVCFGKRKMTVPVSGLSPTLKATEVAKYVRPDATATPRLGF